jgi:hypothetical protein
MTNVEILKLEINDGSPSIVISDFGSNSLSTDKIGNESACQTNWDNNLISSI